VGDAASPVASLRRRVDLALSGWADREIASEDELGRAVREALLSPGKRVRPVLMLLVGELFATPPDRLLDLALIVEMVHAASLVLDDLPSMDDAPLRRGRPSLHRAFGEATAILAAFDLLNRAHAFLPAALEKARIPRRLAQTAGRQMAATVTSLCAGQILDLAGAAATVEELERVHAGKTGALFVLSAGWGAMAGRATRAERDAVEDFARNLGLAFQVVDDALDASAPSARLGKPTGQDAGKVTFVDLLGLEGSRRLARELADTAVTALAGFGRRAETLCSFAREVIERDA